MQQGRGGIGSRKHSISGHCGPSPRGKYMRALEDNKEKEAMKRPQEELRYSTVRDAVSEFKPRRK